MASQVPLVALAFDHEHVGELVEMGRTRGAQAEPAEWVFDDLVRGRKNPRTGHRGLSCEQVLIDAVMKAALEEAPMSCVCEATTLYRRVA